MVGYTGFQLDTSGTQERGARATPHSYLHIVCDNLLTRVAQFDLLYRTGLDNRRANNSTLHRSRWLLLAPDKAFGRRAVTTATDLPEI